MINTVYTALYKGVLQDGGARFSIWICDDIGESLNSNISIRKFGLQSLTFRLYTIKLWWLDKFLYIYM